MPLTATRTDVCEETPYTTVYSCPVCGRGLHTHLYVRTDIAKDENVLCVAMTCTHTRCVFHTVVIDKGVLCINAIPQMLRNMYAEIVQFMGEDDAATE